MCSIRATRVSRSLSLICTGSSSGGVLAHPPASAATSATTNSLRMALSLRRLRRLTGRCEIHELYTAVLRPCRLIVPCGRRPLLAVAYRRDLSVRGALQQHCAAHRLRASLAQADVVFTRAALVRVSLEPNASVRVAGEVLRMRGHDVSALAFDLAAVEIEVHDALCKQSGLGTGGFLLCGIGA